MNETRTINLNGMVYHIDYDAYQILKDYLHDIEMRLPVNDRQEVMADLEARIAELFQKTLFAKNVQVINVEMVNRIKTQIGAPSEFGENRRPRVKVAKTENSGCGRIVGIVLKIFLVLLALPTIGFIGIVLFSLFITFFAVNIGLGASFMPFIGGLGNTLMDGGVYIVPLTLIAALTFVIIPIVMLTYAIITFMRTRRGPKARFWWITIILWLLSLGGLIYSFSYIYRSTDNAPAIFHSMLMDEWDMDETGVVSTALALPAYHSVVVKGAAVLHIKYADTISTKLTSQLVPMMLDEVVKTEVRDSVLYIDVNTSAMHLDEMMVDFVIAVPEMRKITVYGASMIETLYGQTITQQQLTLDLNGAAEADLSLAVEKLDIDAKGASKLELEGSAHHVDVTIAGAGELEAEDLIAQTMHINCAGVSQAEVNVQRELWAQAAGASKITYKGNPTIKQNMAVGGSLIRRDR